jgi:hypothetical protein
METEKTDEEIKPVPTKTQRPPVVWITWLIVFLVLLVGVVILGGQVEQRYGSLVLRVLPPASPKIVEQQKEEQAISPTPTAAEKTISPSPTTASGEFILPFSNTREVTAEDLNGLSFWEMKVARNEIYARHGRSFISKDLSCYFAKQGWYKVDPSYSDSSLSSIETTNVEFILNFEQAMNSPIMNQDSGCNH